MTVHLFQGPFETSAQRNLARRRVNRGAALLTEALGPHWPLDLQLEGLDLQMGDRCVVGQLAPMLLEKLGDAEQKRDWGDYVEYEVGIMVLGIAHDNKQAQHGFNTDRKLNFEQLQYAWEIKIGELQRDLQQDLAGV